MAYGEFSIKGSEVFDALTRYNSEYGKVLNRDGERLADLIAERVLATIAKRLAKQEGEDE